MVFVYIFAIWLAVHVFFTRTKLGKELNKWRPFAPKDGSKVLMVRFDKEAVSCLARLRSSSRASDDCEVLRDALALYDLARERALEGKWLGLYELGNDNASATLVTLVKLKFPVVDASAARKSSADGETLH